MNPRYVFSILVLSASACASDDPQDATSTAPQTSGGTAMLDPSTTTEAGTTESESGATTQRGETEEAAESSTGATPSTTLLRFAQMSVEQPPVMLCVDGEPIEPLGTTAVSYPEVTAYLSVASDATVSVVAADADCQAKPSAQVQLEHGADELTTLVLFGDPTSQRRPLQMQALLDESGVAPPNMMSTRLRNFHTDTDVGRLDVGIEPAPGTQLFLFQDVPYGGVAQGSSVGRVSERGYVNVPSAPPADRLNIWLHGTTDLLGWFPTSDLPFVGGDTFTVFPAGRALTGIPEAVLCTDTVVKATADQLLTACEVFVADTPKG